MEKLYVFKLDSDIISDINKLRTFRKNIENVDKFVIIQNGKVIVDSIVFNKNYSNDIVSSFYTGYINNLIIKELSNIGNCVGISGLDNNLFMGNEQIIETINENYIISLLDNNINPIIAPIVCDTYSQLYINTTNQVLIKTSEILSLYYDVMCVYVTDNDDNLEDVDIDNITIKYKNYKNIFS